MTVQAGGAVEHNSERCGPFELLQQIDSGGMGEIFVARRASDPSAEPVVIKRIRPKLASDPKFVGMFQDEARLAVRLQHENLCKVYESGEGEGTYYLVMEWIQGLSVRALINRVAGGEALPPGAVARVGADVARALSYAHELTDEQGEPLHVIHRDVSPPNIMVRHDGVAKLLDFGLAKARSQLHKTMPGVVKGKFRYLAPEQTQSTPVDPRADVFSLGLCLYEMLTGSPLFDQEGDLDTVLALRQHRTPPSVCVRRPELDCRFDELLQRALAADPAQRFQTASEMQQALEALCEDDSRERLQSLVKGQSDESSAEPAATPADAHPSPARTGEAAPLGAPPGPLGPLQTSEPQSGRTAWWLALGGVLLVAGAAVAWLLTR